MRIFFSSEKLRMVSIGRISMMTLATEEKYPRTSPDAATRFEREKIIAGDGGEHGQTDIADHRMEQSGKLLFEDGAHRQLLVWVSAARARKGNVFQIRD